VYIEEGPKKRGQKPVTECQWSNVGGLIAKNYKKDLRHERQYCMGRGTTMPVKKRGMGYQIESLQRKGGNSKRDSDPE